jgi:hypothetical protein
MCKFPEVFVLGARFFTFVASASLILAFSSRIDLAHKLVHWQKMP